MASFIFWAALATARAQESDSCFPPLDEPITSWSTSGASQRLHIASGAGKRVSVTFRAILAELETTWIQGPYDTTTDGLLIDVDTSQAWLHKAAEDYVTDLIVTADVSGVRVRAPVAYLAWPNGQAAGAVVWTGEQQRTLAPHGVLATSSVAATVDTTNPEERWMPDVSDSAPARQPRELPDTGGVP
jgi:hypothetical protein